MRREKLLGQFGESLIKGQEKGVISPSQDEIDNVIDGMVGGTAQHEGLPVELPFAKEFVW